MYLHRTIYSISPDPEELLKLDQEEIGAVILESLNSIEHLQLNRHDFGLQHTVQEYPASYYDRLLRALMTGWGYLEREGFIAEMPSKPGWFFITDRGKKIQRREDLAAHRAASLFPKCLLHPVIAQKVEMAFVNAEYDTAVFQALREVEVAVRAAGGFAHTDIGPPLMRQAFDPWAGPLCDDASIELERQALADLYAGLLGAYKNARSHRQVVLDATEAVEVIIFASHLLKIVAARAEKLEKVSEIPEKAPEVLEARTATSGGLTLQ